MYNQVVDRRNMRVALFAGILLACLLLVSTLYNSAFAQENGTIMYAENDTGAVATFTATDPEGKDITWTLDGDDDDDFKIDDGVLTFASPPDYEDPSGSLNDDSNTYTVTVVASAGTSTDATVVMDEYPVTVEVTNVEEDGSIMLSTLQPQVEIPITATISDPDNPDATSLVELTWEWLRGEDVIAGGDWRHVYTHGHRRRLCADGEGELRRRRGRGQGCRD